MSHQQSVCLGFYILNVSAADQGAAHGPVTMAATTPYPRVFFDIAVGRRAVGRLKFELFHDVTPITAENFRCLCTGETGLGYWLRPRWYRRCNIHKVYPGFGCQGGDFNFGSGSMGESIYGQHFRDEKMCYKHSKRGVLTMANNGKRNFNNSQFFITFAPAPWLDGKHVVFGHVVSGFHVLDAIEEVGSEGGQTRKQVWIHECGEESQVFFQRRKERSSEASLKPDSEQEEVRAAKHKVAIERPEALPYVKENSPVPDDVWRKAKARADNML